MSITKGANLGNIYVQNIERGYSFAGGGRTTTIPFSKMPCDVNGLIPCVVDIYIEMPPVVVEAPSGAPVRPTNWLDGVFMASLLQNVKLDAGSDSPFAQLPGGATIIDSGDWRTLQALEYCAGYPVIVHGSPDRWGPGPIASGGAVPAGPVSGSAALFTPGETRDYGWFPEIGPYWILNSAAASASELNLVLNLPIGRRKGEPWGLNPIPAAYFTGNGWPNACQQGSPGFVQITTALETHGLQLEWDPNGKVNIYASYILVPPDAIPLPTMMKYRQTLFDQQRYYTFPGIHEYMAFQNPLDPADGSMQAEDYEQVQISIDGNIIVSSAQDESRIRQFATRNWRSGRFSLPRHFTPDAYATAGDNWINPGTTPYGTDRFRTPYMLLADGDQSLLKQAGSDKNGMLVDIILTGQQEHTLIEGISLAHTAASLAKHAELFPVKNATVFPNTKSGNFPSKDAAAAILPAETISAESAVKGQ